MADSIKSKMNVKIWKNLEYSLVDIYLIFG